MPFFVVLLSKRARQRIKQAYDGVPWWLWLEFAVMAAAVGAGLATLYWTTYGAYHG